MDTQLTNACATSVAVKTVRVYTSLDEIPDSYAPLFAAANRSENIFISYAWLKNLFSTSLNQEYTLRLFALEENGIALALVPMCFAKTARTWYQPKKIQAAANYYTSLYSLLNTDDFFDSKENLSLLIKEIVNEGWNSIDFHPMATESTEFSELELACKNNGLLVQRYFCFGNWYLKLNGRTYQDYFNQLPSRLKNTLQRKSKQLVKTEGLQMKLFTREEHLAEAILAYQQVYAASWKQPEAHAEFIPALIHSCARQGSLRLGIAYFNDQPVAAQLWLVHQKIASIFKLSYDERYAKLSIGSILTAYMMEYVIDTDLVDEVDYLTGDDHYKQDWMSGRRERWGIQAYSLNSLFGFILAGWHVGRTRIKKILVDWKLLN